MKSGDGAESRNLLCPAEIDASVEETEGTRGILTMETELQPAAVSGEAQDGVEEQAVEIELDTVPVGDSDESPPDYTRVLREATPPPLSYEEALATETLTPHSERALTAEAPPSYRQLFVREVEPVKQSHAHPRQGRYVLRRQENQRRETERDVTWLLKGDHDEGTIVKIILLVAILLIGVCVSIALIIFGAANYQDCSGIPLYLIVTGALILLDLSFHTIIFIFGGYHDDGPPMCYRIRHCDCFALLFFAWLFVGTHLRVTVGGCSSTLYTCTTVLIICQYVAAVVALCLCCIYVKTRCPCTDNVYHRGEAPHVL